MPYRYQIGGLIVLLLAVVLASVVYGSDKRWTYEERFLQDIRLVMTPTEPSVPDDVEAAFWQCWGRAFLDTQVTPSDRAKLDALAAGRWNPKDPLVVKYHDRVQAAFDDPSGLIAREVSRRMPAICSDDYNAFLDALEG